MLETLCLFLFAGFMWALVYLMYRHDGNVRKDEREDDRYMEGYLRGCRDQEEFLERMKKSKHYDIDRRR